MHLLSRLKAVIEYDVFGRSIDIDLHLTSKAVIAMENVAFLLFKQLVDFEVAFLEAKATVKGVRCLRWSFPRSSLVFCLTRPAYIDGPVGW